MVIDLGLDLINPLAIQIPSSKFDKKIRWAWASISDLSWWAKGNADYTYTSKFRGRFHYVYLIPLYLNLYFKIRYLEDFEFQQFQTYTSIRFLKISFLNCRSAL